MTNIIPIQQVIDSPNICVQPWVGAVVDADGRGALCCEITEGIPTHSIANNSLRENQHAELPARLRAEMIAGNRPKECWRCFTKEDSGVPSLRNTLNEWYSTDVGKVFDLTAVEPVHLELRFGNLCQLQCVMCHPSRSRKVANAQQYALENQGVYNPILLSHFNPKYQVHDFNWMKDPVIWETQILPHIELTKRIFINGGEPLMVKEHFVMLQKLIDLGVAGGITLFYSTNLLAFEPSIVELWKHYKLVSVAISVDDTGERNHFIRYPTDWTALTTAIQTAISSTADYPNIHLHLWCAINQLSFPYLGEYVRIFSSTFPTLRLQGWRGIDSPSYLSPSNLPTEFKQHYREEIQKAIIDSGWGTHLMVPIDKIVTDPPNPDLLKLGLENLRLQGEYRNLNMYSIFDRLQQFECK